MIQKVYNKWWMILLKFLNFLYKKKRNELVHDGLLFFNRSFLILRRKIIWEVYANVALDLLSIFTVKKCITLNYSSHYIEILFLSQEKK